MNDYVQQFINGEIILYRPDSTKEDIQDLSYCCPPVNLQTLWQYVNSADNDWTHFYRNTRIDNWDACKENYYERVFSNKPLMTAAEILDRSNLVTVSDNEMENMFEVNYDSIV